VIFSRDQRQENGVSLAPAGPGGLVASMAPVIRRTGGTWLFASTSQEEADIARFAPHGIERDGITYRLIDLPGTMHHDHYEVISTGLLMPLFHYLLPLAGSPAFDAEFGRAWENYRLVNARYAQAVRQHATDGQPVLVEDLHLMLVASSLRGSVSGAGAGYPSSYFHHVPWCAPDYFGVLPSAVRAEILAGLLSFDSAGFHCRRWLEAFWACCERFLPGAARSGDVVTWQGRRVRLVASRASIDTGAVADTAARASARQWRQRFSDIGAGRRLIVRVERADPAKNTVRGLSAYAALLERRPSLAETTCMLAALTPVRTWMPEYRDYLDQCRAIAAAVNEKFAARPVCLHLGEQAHAYDHHRALGALGAAHTVMVTSTFDGCNLVAMEATAAGGRPAVVLSENTGAYEWFGPRTLPVNPFDVAGTSEALEWALDEDEAMRNARAAALREAVAAHTPEDWVRDRLADLC
jgi:trehalose 6-phosphate synthase